MWNVKVGRTAELESRWYWRYLATAASHPMLMLYASLALHLRCFNKVALLNIKTRDQMQNKTKLSTLEVLSQANKISHPQSNSQHSLLLLLPNSEFKCQ